MSDVSTPLNDPTGIELLTTPGGYKNKNKKLTKANDPTELDIEYMEVQILGGVRLEDIEEIYVPRGLEVPQEVYDMGINVVWTDT